MPRDDKSIHVILVSESRKSISPEKSVQTRPSRSQSSSKYYANMEGKAQARYGPTEGEEQSIPVLTTKKAVSSWVHLLAGAYVFSSYYHLSFF